MASRVDICNLALTALDAGSITALTDNSKGAVTMSRIYSVVRDAALADQNWNFARQRFNPALLSSTPLWGYSNEYQLPANCLRLVTVRELDVGVPSLGARYSTDYGAPYAVEGGKLLCNYADVLNCAGIFRIENEAIFDALFIPYLAYSLAEYAHDALTRKGGAKLEQITRFKNAARRNAVIKGAITDPPEEIPDESWVMSRIGP